MKRETALFSIYNHSAVWLLCSTPLSGVVAEVAGGVEQGLREFALVLSDMFGQFSAKSFTEVGSSVFLDFSPFAEGSGSEGGFNIRVV